MNKSYVKGQAILEHFHKRYFEYYNEQYPYLNEIPVERRKHVVEAYIKDFDRLANRWGLETCLETIDYWFNHWKENGMVTGFRNKKMDYLYIFNRLNEIELDRGFFRVIANVLNSIEQA